MILKSASVKNGDGWRGCYGWKEPNGYLNIWSILPSPAELIGKAEAAIVVGVCSKVSVCVGSCPKSDFDGSV